MADPEGNRNDMHTQFLIFLFPFVWLFDLRAGIFPPSKIGPFVVFYTLLVWLLAHKDLTWSEFKGVTKATVSDVGAGMFHFPIDNQNCLG